MSDGPTLEEMCKALADVLWAHGTPSARELSSYLRANPVEICEADFAAIARAIGLQPSQVFSAYLFRLAQATGWAHPALTRVRLLEGALQ
jgi:ABC-type dipeptide/oligopeptide/nickel transport system permease component